MSCPTRTAIFAGTGGAQDPKRGAQDPDPDDGALKIAPSEGGGAGDLVPRQGAPQIAAGQVGRRGSERQRAPQQGQRRS